MLLIGAFTITQHQVKEAALLATFRATAEVGQDAIYQTSTATALAGMSAAATDVPAIGQNVRRGRKTTSTSTSLLVSAALKGNEHAQQTAAEA